MYAGAALAATTLAHLLTVGSLELTTFAPLSWGLLVVLALLAGRRASEFTTRGPAELMGRLILAQALLHVAMVQAPWAFGMHAHHAEPLVSVRAVAAHAVTAVVLGLLAMRGERLLAAAVQVAETVRRFVAVGVAPRARGHRGFLVRRLPADVVRPATAVAGAHRTRGPPMAGLHVGVI